MTINARDEMHNEDVAAMIRRRQSAAWWLGGPAHTRWRDPSAATVDRPRHRRPAEPFAYLDTSGTWRDHTGRALVSELDIVLGVPAARGEVYSDVPMSDAVAVPLIERQRAIERATRGLAA